MSALSIKLNHGRINGATTSRQKAVIHPNFFNWYKTNIRYGEKSMITIFKIKNPIPVKSERESNI